MRIEANAVKIRELILHFLSVPAMTHSHIGGYYSPDSTTISALWYRIVILEYPANKARHMFKAKSGPFQRQTRSIPTRLPAPARKSPRSTPPCLVACPNAPSKQGLRSIVLTVTLLSDNLYSLFWLEISVIILGKDLLQHSCCNLQDPPFRVIMDNYGCL